MASHLPVAESLRSQFLGYFVPDVPSARQRLALFVDDGSVGGMDLG